MLRARDQRAPSLRVAKAEGAGIAEDHRQQDDGRALWDKIPRGLLIGLAIVGAGLIVVMGLWAIVRLF
jgi:hypothetical protein